MTKREKLREQVKSLDAFTKVDPDMEIQQTSTSGGLTTIVALSFIAFLVWSEIVYYNTLQIRYKYSVDKDKRSDMNLTMDITIAMNCEHLGADYIDISGGSTDAGLYLAMEPAHFELSPNQLEWVQAFAKIKEQEGSRGVDSLQRFLHGSMREPMPEAAPEIGTPPDSCRLHGSLPISKVAANFHITAGKSVHHGGNKGHSHTSNMVPQSALNFSHRIDRFSFSEETIGAHTLDGDLKVTSDNNEMFQYFLKVVPSTTQRLGQSTPYRSNQYSVTEQRYVVNPASAIPGIYFKYDIEALAVHVIEEHRPFGQFFIRLCGIVGGIFATTGMLHQFIGALHGTLANKGKAKSPLADSSSVPPPAAHAAATVPVHSS